uniref:Interleukin-32 n=1 Tax=Capra hircus TaxID=9925 RepID=A0A8C2PJK9_CAPHI
MGSGALASFRLTWMHGRPQLGPDLRSKAGVRTAHSSPQEKLNEDFYEFLEDKIQENLPESLQESSPLLQEASQEVRCRFQRPSVTACLEVQNPEESIWARALRRFQGILQSLQQRCWDVLTWLQEKAVAFLEAVCSAVPFKDIRSSTVSPNSYAEVL